MILIAFITHLLRKRVSTANRLKKGKQISINLSLLFPQHLRLPTISLLLQNILPQQILIPLPSSLKPFHPLMVRTNILQHRTIPNAIKHRILIKQICLLQSQKALFLLLPKKRSFSYILKLLSKQLISRLKLRIRKRILSRLLQPLEILT